MIWEEVFALLLTMLVPMCDPYSARMPVLATWDIRSEESEMYATKIGNGQASDQCICRGNWGNWAERCYLLLVLGKKQRRKYNNIHFF
jgi:hypothetical protein